MVTLHFQGIFMASGIRSCVKSYQSAIIYFRIMCRFPKYMGQSEGRKSAV